MSEWVGNVSVTAVQKGGSMMNQIVRVFGLLGIAMFFGTASLHAAVDAGESFDAAAVTQSGCDRYYCVGERVYQLRDYVMTEIAGFQPGGLYVLRYLEGPYSGTLGGNWRYEQLGRTRGCTGRHCVGDRVYQLRDYVLTQIVGLEPSGRFVLRYLEGVHSGKSGGNWQPMNIAVTQGCMAEFCVGDRVFQLRDYVQTRIAGLQPDGRYVLYYLEGPHAGQVGGNWSRERLARLH